MALFSVGIVTCSSVHLYIFMGCWGVGHIQSSPGTLVYCFEVVLIPVHTACFPECWELPLAMCCTTVLALIYLKLLILFFGLRLLSLCFLATMCVIEVSHILFLPNAFFCTGCVSIPCTHISTCSLSISFMFL